MSTPLTTGKPTSKQFDFSILFYSQSGKADKIRHFKARVGEFLVVDVDWHEPGIHYATAEDYRKLGELLPPEEKLAEAYEEGKAAIRSYMVPQRWPKEGDDEERRHSINGVQELVKKVVDKVLSLHRLNFESNTEMRNFFESLRDYSRDAIDILESARHKERAEQKAAREVRRAFTCPSDCKHLPEYGTDNFEELPVPCQWCRRCEHLEDKYEKGETEA